MEPFAKEVRLARPGNHAVKCFLDDPNDPDAFTVDAMPALRQADGALLVPEKSPKDWIRTDPEDLIQRWSPIVKVPGTSFGRSCVCSSSGRTSRTPT